MNRKSVPVNVARRLWAQCGGFCQNPDCNKPLFRAVGGDTVSLANVAHIIGHGIAGPRSGHELATYIDKDGVENLIMLCLACHKTIDELEKQFSVEQIKQWKINHAGRVAKLFSIPRIYEERELLIEVNDLLDNNKAIFQACGPFSDAVLFGDGGDALKIWHRRSLDTILPNNQRIIDLIEQNKRNFPYPWDVYKEMLTYKIHVEAFQDNCLTEQRINDYKLFPQGFDFFIKTKLGIPAKKPQIVKNEELEFRHNQVKTFIDRFLSNHDYIFSLNELNKGTLIVRTIDQREIKVFVTNTYYFTDYTLDRVLEIDPAVNAIICSCPAGQYSDSAKRECIKKRIGLFMLREFMGAIRYEGARHLNFLVRSELNHRLSVMQQLVQGAKPPTGIKVFVFGSFLRQKLYDDIDVMILHNESIDFGRLSSFEQRLSDIICRRGFGYADITVSSFREFDLLRLSHDNLRQIYPSK